MEIVDLGCHHESGEANRTHLRVVSGTRRFLSRVSSASCGGSFTSSQTRRIHSFAASHRARTSLDKKEKRLTMNDKSSIPLIVGLRRRQRWQYTAGFAGGFLSAVAQHPVSLLGKGCCHARCCARQMPGIDVQKTVEPRSCSSSVRSSRLCLATETRTDSATVQSSGATEGVFWTAEG